VTSLAVTKQLGTRSCHGLGTWYGVAGVDRLCIITWPNSGGLRCG
jgi:hypothetical protein